MTVLRDAEVAGHRKEHEGVLHGEVPFIDEELRGLLARDLQRVVEAVARRTVRLEGVGRLGDRPTTGLALDDVDLHEHRAADFHAGAGNLAVAH